MKTQYRCKSGERREAVRIARKDGKPILNGIDYLEVASTDQKTLIVYFLHNLPGSSIDPVPPGPELTAENIMIDGGTRITAISIEKVEHTAPNELTITVANPGDFSIYTLHIITSEDDPTPPRGFDPLLSEIEFSFKVECSNDFDCKQSKICQPESIPLPEINYLAKDYASFCQAMLDRMAVLMPNWKERNQADLCITLVELLAYVADYLSYHQDAVATEAYLGTARRRVSVRRHARLVDYFMHDGCNARTWVQIRVKKDVLKAALGDPPRLPAGTMILTCIQNQGPRIPPPNSVSDVQYLYPDSEVFETMAPINELYLAHNDIYFHTWGAHECCLPRGATRATLKGTYSNLKKGDVLIFKEIRGPLTGEMEDADPSNRHAVRLVNIVTKDRDNNDLTDPLNGQAITEIEWHAEDALPFPLCISSTTDKEHGQLEIDVSIALGNIVLVDHGRRITDEELGTVPRPSIYRITVRNPAGNEERQAVPQRFRPRLKEAPLIQRAPYPYEENEDSPKSAKAAMRWNMRSVLPDIIELKGVLKTNTTIWEPKHDLLSSGPNDTDFVVETETDGTAYLRFGDDRYGSRPASDTEFIATYRIGNGVRGNVGAGALAHIITDIPDIDGVCNPLPAQGGIEPESIEEVRQNAPSAFRTQERAVTPEDYSEMAQRYPGVQCAAATLRWTGSWHTVFLTVDRLGGAGIDDVFETGMHRHLESYRMAGHDLEIDNPRLVPLEIDMHVCVQPDYFLSDVKAALLQVFSNRILPDGRRGVFHPDNFTFGQSVFLSPLYEAAEGVEGVASVKITTFQRQDVPSTEALTRGELTLGRLEIACLENDPNFPERGIFRLKMEGGK